MSLIKSRELFGETGFPIAVDTVLDRTLVQKELHRHEYFEMLFVEKGSLINRFKGAEIQLKTGDVLIMKPYVLHVLEDVWRKQPGKAYCCSFLPQAVDSNIQSLEELKISSSPNGYFFKPAIYFYHKYIKTVFFRIIAVAHMYASAATDIFPSPERNLCRYLAIISTIDFIHGGSFYFSNGLFITFLQRLLHCS
mgnify:CR=1 FL=1